MCMCVCVFFNHFPKGYTSIPTTQVILGFLNNGKDLVGTYQSIDMYSIIHE